MTGRGKEIMEGIKKEWAVRGPPLAGYCSMHQCCVLVHRAVESFEVVRASPKSLGNGPTRSGAAFHIGGARDELHISYDGRVMIIWLNLCLPKMAFHPP